MAMFGGSLPLLAQTERLEITGGAGDGKPELRWQAKVPRLTGLTPLSMRYQAYQSDDLKTWSAVGEPLVGQGEAEMRLTLDSQATQQYYRLALEPEFQFFDKNSDTVVSYADQRDYHFESLADLSVDDFEGRYGPSVGYREAIDWDVTQAQFWDMFAMSPEEHNANRPADDPDRRLYDFRLNDRETSMMKANGFVVTPRHQRKTFVDMFYDIWTDDLPVYFSTDAALQAWHRSYQMIVEELEEFYLRRELLMMLTEMRNAFPAVWEANQAGPLGEGLRDADFFLTIAASLTVAEEDPFADLQKLAVRHAPYLADEQDRVRTWLDRVEAHDGLLKGGPFGTEERFTDFSQFTVRGHYANSATLAAYLRAMTWLGQIDFRMGGGDPEPGSLRQLAGAVSLSLLLKESGQLERWHRFEDAVSLFVGLSDSMTPPQMLGLLEREDLAGFDGFDESDDLVALQSTILAGPYGQQEIAGHPIKACGAEETVLPRSFTFFGQRYTPDSWVFSEVTYNRVPFARRLPSSLDVAFAALDNRATVPLISSQIRDTQGVAFRDGFPYQPYLTASHQTLQAQEPLFWETNIYQGWLGALRALSPPTTASPFPQAMQTEAWAMKNLNTQLASWTQLRHDTILYVKQSVTPPFLCDYPAGYVEPRLEFWTSMARMAQAASELVAGLDMGEQGEIEVSRFDRDSFAGGGMIFDLAERQQVMVEHFRFVADIMGTLIEITQRELNRQPLTEAQALFMKGLVESTSVDYVGSRTYSGWYPDLHYPSALLALTTRDHPSVLWDALVVDVHTDSPSQCHGSPGGILHEAVGNVDYMMFAANHGDEGCVFAGPVFSYYEMVEPFPKRLNDQEWKERVNVGQLPPRPSWTKTYLAD